jgi:hypothetical protein
MTEASLEFPAHWDETQEITADMASFGKEVTGVDNTIFVSVKYPQHAARIKVAVDPPTHFNPFGRSASVTGGRAEAQTADGVVARPVR